jgi:uncharacterized protein YbjT (DUF2867 family)
MTKAPALAITGATGRLGGRIARRIASAGASQRLVVRDPRRAPDLPGATAVPASYAERDAVRAALEGVATVLMVSASESADRVAQHLAFVDAAAEAGVEHLVYISFFGAAPNSTFTLARDHDATEQHIRASGLGFTFLRDNLYADFAPQMVGADDAIAGPGGSGRSAVVAQADVARSAAAVLTEPRTHRGRTYNLTGPESLSFAEIAALL